VRTREGRKGRKKERGEGEKKKIASITSPKSLRRPHFCFASRIPRSATDWLSVYRGEGGKKKKEEGRVGSV